MTQQPFELHASNESLTIKFDPPITSLQWRAVWTLLATEYKLQDVDTAFRRYLPEVSQVREMTLTSWRPHGTRLQDSLIEKMERDITCILNDQPVEGTRLVDLTQILGFKD